MFQPAVKAAFVDRYCSPTDGWSVYVDIDASKLGKTGGERRTEEAKRRQALMTEEGEVARNHMQSLGVTVGGSLRGWLSKVDLDRPLEWEPLISGDRDIIAIHPAEKLCLVAEVEGLSPGHPETKMYKALGQIVTALDSPPPVDFEACYIVVVYGEKMGNHLQRANKLKRLGVAGITFDDAPELDKWVFGVENLPFISLRNVELPPPIKFEFGEGGYFGDSYSVEFKDGLLETKKYRHSEGEEPISGKIFNPSNGAWHRLRRSLAKLGVWDWNEEYVAVGVCDGTSWGLSVEWDGNTVESGGSNAYPFGYPEFSKVVNELIGKEWFGQEFEDDDEEPSEDEA